MEAASRSKILFIEDEEAVARLFQTYLELSGYEVHVESQGALAVEYASEHRPDLVLLDLRLPDIDGYEVCRELRDRYPAWQVPIIMLTGMDTSADRARGIAYGADAYLTKPVEPPALLPVIERLLNRAAPEE